MRHVIIYHLWGCVSTAAIRLYYWMPRETLQDELISLHRFALKQAHNARRAGRPSGVEADGDA